MLEVRWKVLVRLKVLVEELTELGQSKSYSLTDRVLLLVLDEHSGAHDHVAYADRPLAGVLSRDPLDVRLLVDDIDSHSMGCHQGSQPEGYLEQQQQTPQRGPEPA